MFDISENISPISLALIKTFEFEQGALDSKDGQRMVVELAMLGLKFFHFAKVTNTGLENHKLAQSIAELFFKNGHSEAYVKAKEIADKLVTIAYASDDSFYDDKPEGEAAYIFEEFLEDALHEVEQMITELDRDVVYQFTQPKDQGGLRFIVAEALVNKGSVLKAACGSNNTYREIIRSIIIG